MHYQLLILLVLAPLFECVFICTGRGVVKPYKQTNSWAIHEGTFDPKLGEHPYNDNSQKWIVQQDGRFPNGYFISSRAASPVFLLVWDASQQQGVPGTQVILYQKKDTLDGTRNQRWNITDGKIKTMLNQNLFVNVSSTAPNLIKLANNAPNSPYQTFYLVDDRPYDAVVEVRAGFSVWLSAEGPCGPINWGLLAYSLRMKIVDGYMMTIKDASGNVIPPSPLNITRELVRYPIVVPLDPFPSGVSVWIGTMTSSSNGYSFVSELQLTFNVALVDGWGTFSGSGSDEFGSFTVTNANYNNENVAFTKTYSTSSLVVWCNGDIGPGATILSGTWYNNEETDYGTFEYNLQ